MTEYAKDWFTVSIFVIAALILMYFAIRWDFVDVTVRDEIGTALQCWDHMGEIVCSET